MQYEIQKVDELSHHGILGQKWGIRRFQYKDGSLTDEGRKRYGSFKESISKWRVRMKEKSETKKKDLIDNGTPKQIQKNIKMFSTDELKQINTRFSEQKKVYDEVERLAKSSKAESTPAKKNDVFESYTESTKSFFSAIDNTNKATENAKKLYNNVTSAYNFFGGNHRPLWT